MSHDLFRVGRLPYQIDILEGDTNPVETIANVNVVVVAFCLVLVERIPFFLGVIKDFLKYRGTQRNIGVSFNLVALVPEPLGEQIYHLLGLDDPFIEKVDQKDRNRQYI